MRKPAVSAGALALAGVLLLFCHTALARDPDWRPYALASFYPPWIYTAGWNRAWTMPSRPEITPVAGTMPFRSPWQAERAPAVGPEAALSPSQFRVSQAAARHGDRDYLMVDKTRGLLIQFVNGAPVFVTHALTGTSLADRMPPEAFRLSYTQQSDARYRVTPAGRFTVSHGFDHVVGATLDINEIKGKDWAIAIHSTGSAKREARLHSPLDQDKHVTEGCVNVAPETMRRLATLPTPRGRIPLYILPMDERLISELF